MFHGKTVALVIPALDEEETLPPLLARVDRDLVDRLVVADNGSSDGTARAARRAGAIVAAEPRKGYGAACLAGIRAAGPVDLFVFMDGDGSDDPSEIERVLAPLAGGQADLVIGSRVLGGAEKGAFTFTQRFGNILTCRLVRLFWGIRFTDLGPFRGITREALEKLEMADLDYGWTIEMQVKAVQMGMKVLEVPVSRKVRQAGRSKVTGNLKASFLAGKRILGYVFKAKLGEWFRL